MTGVVPSTPLQVAGALPQPPLSPTVVSRTAVSTTYANADGTRTSLIHSGVINYQDAAGAWRPIDARIVPDVPGFVHNAAGPLDIKFPSTSVAGPLVTVSGTGWSVAVGLDTAIAGVDASVAGTTLRYAGVVGGADVRYKMLSGGVKEDVIMPDRAHASSEYRFPLTLVGVSPSQDPDGTVEFKNVAGETVAVVPPGQALDSARGGPFHVEPARTPISTALTGGPLSWALVVDIPTDWLNDPARVFPIDLDPTITNLGRQTYGGDAIVRSDHPDWTYNGGNQWDGGSYVNSIGYVFGVVEFDSFAHFDMNGVFGKHINSGVWHGFVKQVNDVGHPFWVNAAAAGWDENNVNYNSNRSYYDGVSDYSPTGETTRDITGFVANWASGAWGANGIYYDSHGDPNDYYSLYSDEESPNGVDSYIAVNWSEPAPQLGTTQPPDGSTFVEGTTITFSQAWSSDYAQARMFVCRGPGINPSTGCTAPEGQWVGPTGWQSSGTASLNYTLLHSDVGIAPAPKKFDIYICTTENVCSSPGERTMNVTNRPPTTSGNVSLNPASGVVDETKNLTFTVSYSDFSNDTTKALVCKNSNAPIGTSCNPATSAGTWASGTGVTSGQASATYTPPAGSGSDSTFSYWVYACDQVSCSTRAPNPPSTPTFRINKVPTIGAVTPPSAVTAGQTVTFSAPFSDTPADFDYLLVCKSTTATVTAGACTGGSANTWATGGSVAGNAGTASASYATVQNDTQQTNDFAMFVCDTNHACSTSYTGSFTVTNATPAITLVSSMPNPVGVGTGTTFSITWSDGGGDSDYALICKDTSTPINGDCAGGAPNRWAIGGTTPSGTAATATYTPAQGDVGTKDYSAYACDSGHLCSSRLSSTFQVNNVAPTSSSASATSPVSSGSQVTFSVTWNDSTNDTDRALICKSSATPVAGACAGGPSDTWATGTFGTTKPATASAPTTQNDVGTPRAYYPYVCDVGNLCSAALTGTFQFQVNNVAPTLNSTSTPALVNAGTPMTFQANWTDTGGDLDYTTFCKTAVLVNGACAAGAWATSGQSTNGLSSASYTPTASDVGTQNYWAFVCDTANACTAAPTQPSGSFRVNVVPTLTSISDSPHPATAGTDVTFSATFSDGGIDTDRLIVCTSNGISSTGTCTGGTWATGTATATSPATAAHTTSQGEVGAGNNYWAFICDQDNACSATTVNTTGAFAVTNATPSVSSVTDNPDPVSAGTSTTFTVNFTDGGGDADKAFICKTNAAPTSSGCPGGAWASSTAFSSTSPLTVSFPTTEAQVGPNNYWAFACDGANACSPTTASTTGTFTVTNVAPTVTAVTDSPDPVASGATTTFTVAFADTGGDTDRAVICKNGTPPLAGACVGLGSTWATGSATSSGSATATYAATQADLGNNSYWAWACDSKNACTAAPSQPASFTVTNTAPTASTVTANPASVVAGATIDFQVAFSDTGGDSDRAVICATAVITNATCEPNKTIAGPGTATTSSPAHATLATTQTNLGTTTYYAWACDSTNVCSNPALSGTFTVTNQAPSIDTVTATPNPVASGSTITFSLPWTDSPNDSERAVICKTNAIANATCSGGTWARSATLTATSPATVTYATAQTDLGSNTYWPFICDSTNTCTGGASSTFTVTNVQPTLINTSDSPDPVVAGNTTTFSIAWSDTGGDTAKAVICKTNAIAPDGTCPGGTWTTGTASAATPAVATYATAQSDVGTDTYWPFVCDSTNSCTGGSSATFTVTNATPALANATDSPDPVTSGTAITFTVNFTDGGGDADRAIVCKTNSISAAATCPGGSWAAGVPSTTGTATALYTTNQTDVGTRSYWAFACDGTNACSTSGAGTFTVLNATPTVTSSGDSPDPVVAGQPITFTVNYTDGGGDLDRALICKTNATTNGACAAGTWTTGALTASPATATYTPNSQTEVGTNNYWVFACDNSNACSPATAVATFTVTNAPPTATSATVTPNPTTAGRTITFTVGWNDTPGDNDRALICKTNATTNGTCIGGTWASGSLSPTSPATATHATTQDDAGVNDYWAFACDAANSCSNPITGTFSVEATPPEVAGASVAQSDTAGLEDFYPYTAFDLGVDQALVNTATRNLVIARHDLDVPGTGLTLGLTRTYNSSRAASDSPLGTGWNLAITDTPASGLGRGSAILARSDQLAFYDADGTLQNFVKDSSGWHAPAGINLVVDDSRDANNNLVYHLTRPDGVMTTIAKDGASHHVTDVADRAGNHLHFTYTLGRITTVTDTTGRTLTFTWTGPYVSNVRYHTPGAAPADLDIAYTVDPVTHQLTTVTDAASTSDARTVHYAYPAGAITATDGRSNTTRFNLNNGALTNLVDRDGHPWNFASATTGTGVLDGITTVTETDPNNGTWTWTTSTVEHNPQTSTDAGDADPAGNPRTNTSSYLYLANRLRSIVDPAGITHGYDWSTIGQITETRLATTGNLPHVTDYLYANDNPAVGDLTDIHEGVGSGDERDQHFTYTNGLVTSATDPIGNTTLFTYYDHRLLATATDANNHTTRYGDGTQTDRGYDPSGQPLSITDPTGATRTITYDLRGNTKTAVDANNKTWTATFDLRGNATSATDPLGRTTTRCYDLDDNPTLLIAPSSTAPSCALDGTDGHSTKTTFDRLDHPTVVLASSDGQLRKTVNQWTDTGQLTATLEPRSFDPTTGASVGTPQSVQYTRYPNHRISEIQDEDNGVTDLRYTPDGLVTQVSDPAPATGSRHTVTYTYDQFRNPIAELDSGHTMPTQYTYDSHGQLAVIVTPKRVTTTFLRDKDGRPTTVLDGQARASTRAYDPAGNLLTLTTPTDIGGALTSRYSYTARNEIATETDPADTNHTVLYLYDPAGRQVRRDDQWGTSIGRRTTLSYYDDGKLHTRDATFLDGTSGGHHLTSYDYDPDNNTTGVTTTTDGAVTSTITATYTSADQLATWSETIDGITKTGAYSWTPDALLASRTIDSQTSSYTYNGRGLETRDDIPPAGAITRTYTPAGDPDSVHYPNGMHLAQSYDSARRPTDRAITRGDGSTLASWSQVTYDDDDNLTAETASQAQPDGTTKTGAGVYTYDRLDRLFTAKQPFDPNTVAYVLDDAANIITDGARVNSYTHNRLTTTTSLTGGLTIGSDGPGLAFPVTTYTYDHYGNQNQSTTGSDITTINYDAESETRSINQPGGSISVSYEYDGLGRMTRRFEHDTLANTSDTTLLFHDGLTGAIALETDGSGTNGTRYLLTANGAPVGQDQNDTVSDRSWYLTNTRGDNVGLVGASDSQVKAAYAYDPYGRSRPDLSAPPNAAWNSRLRFQLGPQDPTTGTYNLGTRTYNPANSRFSAADITTNAEDNADLAQDPLTGNRYLYAGANPVNLIDDGHSPCLFGKIGWCKKPVKPTQTTGSARLWCTDGRRSYVCGTSDPGKRRTGNRLTPGARSGMNALAFDAMLSAAIIGAQYSGGNSDRNVDSAEEVGASRVADVVSQLGDDVVAIERGVWTPYGSTDIDIITGGNEFIEVGGPAKAENLAKFGQQLQRVAWYAQQNGGTAVFRYAPGTPQSAIDLAEKWFGPGNARPI